MPATKKTAKKTTATKKTVKKAPAKLNATEQLAVYGTQVTVIPNANPTTKVPLILGNRHVPTKIVADDPKFIPMYRTKGAAAVDLVANVTETWNGQYEIRLTPGAVAVVDCGFSMQLPEGYEAQIRPRSGLAEQGITVANAPGTIDDDYRGRVKVIIQNTHRTTITHIKHGERFAQMVIKPVWYFQWQLVSELDASERGTGGFGSTGVA